MDMLLRTDAGVASSKFPFSGEPLLYGLLVLALAHIFARGVELQNERNLTVWKKKMIKELLNRTDIRITIKFSLFGITGIMIFWFLLFLLKLSTGWGFSLNIWQNGPVIAGVFAGMMFLAVREAVEKGAKSGGVE